MFLFVTFFVIIVLLTLLVVLFLHLAPPLFALFVCRVRSISVIKKCEYVRRIGNCWGQRRLRHV
jgi:hypothetical protein